MSAEPEFLDHYAHAGARARRATDVPNVKGETMLDTTTTNVEALEPVRRTGRAPGLANLRPPWRPGQSGNPKGRTSHRRLFEEALGRAVTEHAEELVEALVSRAIAGDVGMMRALLDRLVPRIDRHELAAAEAPSRIVICFEKPGSEPAA